jgi:hypothetical protein
MANLSGSPIVGEAYKLSFEAGVPLTVSVKAQLASVDQSTRLANTSGSISAIFDTYGFEAVRTSQLDASLVEDDVRAGFPKDINVLKPFVQKWSTGADEAEKVAIKAQEDAIAKRIREERRVFTVLGGSSVALIGGTVELLGRHNTAGLGLAIGAMIFSGVTVSMVRQKDPQISLEMRSDNVRSTNTRSVVARLLKDAVLRDRVKEIPQIEK